MTVTISDSAQNRILHLLKDEADNSKLRISVIGGGCSGFQYNFEFDDTKPTKEDILIENGESKVIIDDVSMEFIDGSTLDYIDRLGAAAFEITNPSAKNNCGCGNSFSV